MEPETKPGDAGTEEWSEQPEGSGGSGPLANPVGTTDAQGAIKGSPADEFINDPGAISARDDQA